MTTASALIAPAPEGLLEAYPVSTAVNRTANDNAQLLEPVDLDAAPPPKPARKPAAKPARAKRAKDKEERRAGRVVLAAPDKRYSTFPGFKIPFGSSSFLMPRMKSSATGSL